MGHVIVTNGGLGNGVSREQLLEVLQVFGTVEALLMPPSKPYAFVTYGTVQEAREAYNSLNGRELGTDCNTLPVTLYSNFVEKVLGEDIASPSLPSGLLVVEEFVSPTYEQKLLEFVDWSTDLTNKSTQKSLKHRRVKHYGYEFRYDNNNVDKDKPLPGGLPEICTEVLEKSIEKGYVKFRPDQLTINQYEPGQGIPPHIDTHSAFENGIICLSLGTETVMDFKDRSGHSVAVMLPRRSLLVMTDESRYLWSHGITPRKFDVVQSSETLKPGSISRDISDLTLNKRGTRTSFTFRKVRMTPCDCAYPEVCDSQIGDQCKESLPAVPTSEGDASKLECEYVHKVYNEIADHFSSTRHSPWPKVNEFLKALPDGALVADIGCGNGKYLGVNKDAFMLGCDRSKNLVDICGERKFEVFVCDALFVPLRSGVCDACISIAVIHHFSTQDRRLAAIKEIARLLRPGGKALLYIWAMEQEYHKVKSKYLKESKVTPEETQSHGTEMPTPTNSSHKSKDSNEMDARCFEPSTWVTKDPTVKLNHAKLSVHKNRTAFDSQDLLVPWHLKDGCKRDQKNDRLSCQPLAGSRALPTFHRYYHVFSEGELEKLCKNLSSIRIVHSYYDQGNWCVIIEKC
uniref:tRNA (carboxymethyluridine(34)-5-O)-methyltransferase n=1 Tax=Callorhinchus milii TaxID=7868 RepID=A0A4W3JDD6_CALMI